MNTRDAGPDVYPGPTTRILLVEDDPTSREFIAHALECLPALVDRAGSIREAIAISGRRHHDLWLIDAQLPDGCGSELLSQLRQRGLDTPAIAHTASTDCGVGAALMAAGFADVLIKPLASSAIRHAVGHLLGAPSNHEPPLPGHPAAGPLLVWDDAAAARALGGNSHHVRALRRLFMDELPMVWQRVRSAIDRGEHDALGDELHRLQASCGFVGATRLGEVARLLQGATADALLQARLEGAIAETITQAGQPVPESD